jgi:dihydroorotase
MTQLLLKNIRIVDPVTSRDEAGLDMEIRDGTITRIGRSLASEGFQVHDLKGAVVAPGFFDMHVHLREPGDEHKETIETGTRAAMAGGFTGICCMPNTKPAIGDAFVVSYIKEKAQGNLVDVTICGTMTKDRAGDELAPMDQLVKAGVRMISDDGGAVRSAEMMRRVLEYAGMFDLLATQHCEEHSMTVNAPMNEGRISTKLGLTGWPTVAEDIIIGRDILLTEYVGGVRYHVAHMSTKSGVRLVRDAKARGVKVSCEVTPHHFVLTDEAVEKHGSMAKMNPPLRTQEDIDAVIEGLKDGTIDCISTDHAPHATHDKETDMVTAAFGIIGLETAIGLGLTHLVHAGHLSLMEYIKHSSQNPRALMKLEEIGIEEGRPANLTIVDLDRNWVFEKKHIFSLSSNTPFVGHKMKGMPIGTLNNGQAWWRA